MIIALWVVGLVIALFAIPGLFWLMTAWVEYLWPPRPKHPKYW